MIMLLTLSIVTLAAVQEYRNSSGRKTVDATVGSVTDSMEQNVNSLKLYITNNTDST